MDNKQIVKDFYISRERRKGVTPNSNDENLRVIDCCAIWNLAQELSENDFTNLVTVDCNESKALIKQGRLLKNIADAANQQLLGQWESGRNKNYIEKLLNQLEEDISSMEQGTIILREKVNGEPDAGSYYVQDGNHRIIAAGIYWLRNGTMPKLTFHVGRSVDQKLFFEKSQ